MSLENKKKMKKLKFNLTEISLRQIFFFFSLRNGSDNRLSSKGPSNRIHTLIMCASLALLYTPLTIVR